MHFFKSLFPRLRFALPPLLAGAIFPLAFAPVNLVLMAWASPLLLLWLTRAQTPKQAFWSAYCWGLAAFTVGLSWIHIAIHDIGGAPFWLSALLTLGGASILGLINGALFFVLTKYFSNSGARALAFAPLWVFIEWLRAWFLTGFPWLYIGYSQTDTIFAMFAPIGGVYLISLIIAALIAVTFFLLMRFPNRQWRIAALALFVMQALFFIPPSTMNAATSTDAQPIRAAIIQPNISQQIRWEPEQLNNIVQTYYDMTMSVIGDVDLVIWPEGAIPVPNRYLQDFYAGIERTAVEKNAALIAGGFTEDKAGHSFNSAFGLAGARGEYAKRHLVPFGEYVPFEAQLRGLLAFFDLPMSGLSPGEAEQTVFFREQPVLTAICYETTYPELVRENLLAQTRAYGQAPQWLLTISNDGWYGDSWGPKQHLQIVRMRAQELGLPVLRATPTGLSVAIDAEGKVSAALSAFVPGILKTTIQPQAIDTLWRRYGLWPVLILASLLLGFAVAVQRLKARV